MDLEASENTADRQRWERLGPICLVGHRGAGKSTLGPVVSRRLGRPFFDLDAEISRSSGHAIDDLVENRIDEFRELEARLLETLCEHKPSPIIACGAGARPDPTRSLIIWLDREDWRDEVRSSKRPRVRPDLSQRGEWQWMIDTREPQWLSSAHLRFPIPRARPVERSEDDLRCLLRWLASPRDNGIARRSWLVPMITDDVPRALSDARRLDLAGVEIRSDVCGDPPRLPAGQRYVASLRHDDPRWLEAFSEATIWDIDSRFIPDPGEIPSTDLPDRVILSNHSPRPAPEHLGELFQDVTRLAESLRIRPEEIEVKYVPTVDDFDGLDALLELVPNIRERFSRSTVLPGGPFAAWTRPIFAIDNEQNYLPPGLEGRDSDHPSGLDIQNFLPHLSGPTPASFDLLVGDPVETSQGALWHRRAALSADEGRQSYLKCKVPRGQLDRALSTISRLPVRGVSVTAPLKTEAADSDLIDNRDDLPGLNTLVRRHERGHPWLGIDTDSAGMESCLEWFESRGIGPGQAIVFGRGGASHAVLRALERRGWPLVANLSARRGWRRQEISRSEVVLIVNCAGPHGYHDQHTPTCRAWLDLHYVDVGRPPEGTVHLQGDRFFDAQAKAQRIFWNSEFVDSKISEIQR